MFKAINMKFQQILLFFLGLTMTLNVFAQTSVNLYLNVDGVEEAVISDATKNNPYDLTAATNELREAGKLNGCRGYVFTGWKIGSPAQPDETVAPVMSVTPAANTNIYAVFEKPGVVLDNYVRVTDVSALEAGANYVIVCFYRFNEVNQYYALGNSQTTYEYETGGTIRIGWNNYDEVIRRYKIDAVQLDAPVGGVISNPHSEYVWTLSGSEGNWKWTNTNTSKQLLIRDNVKETGYYTSTLLGRKTWHQATNPDHQILVNSGNTCAVTATDGTFHFKSGDYYLTYVPDAITTDEDYFITDTEEASGYVYYLYKQGSPCTSNPSCIPWSVYLDAVDGTVNEAQRDTLTEANGGSGVDLVAAESGASCSGWSFAGWHKDGPIDSQTSKPTMIEAADFSGYMPTYNGETLYAVYKKNEGKTTTYTSFPHCTSYTVILHAGGGTIIIDGSDTEQKLYEITEDSPLSGITLPSAAPLKDCNADAWTFVGWVEGESVGSYKDTQYDECKPAGTIFIPKHNNTHIYAVYSSLTDHFRIVAYGTASGLEMPQVGENYLITYLTNDIDYQISSLASGTNHLSAVAGKSPMDGAGFYLVEPDTALWWTVGGSNNAWTFKNVKEDKYLTSGNGYVRLGDSPTTYSIARSSTSTSSDRNLRIYSGSYSLYYNGTYFSARNYSDNQHCYLYRQIKEYTSWPHCEPFTVNFSVYEGGTSGAESLTESVAYAGITLPSASANDCAREGWAFAGWAEAPVNEETSTMSFNLYLPNTIFHPVKNNATLYAVFYQKANTFTRITSADQFFLGGNYIVATGDNKALMNDVRYNKIQSINVSPSGGVITNTDTDIEWKLAGTKGEYIFINTAGNDPIYWNLTIPGEGHLTEDPTVDVFYIKEVESGQFTINSNNNTAGFSDGRRLLGYESGYYNSGFITVKEAANIYFYRQDAVYISAPVCAEETDAVKWTKEDGQYYVYVESYVEGAEPRMNNSDGSPLLIESGDLMGTWKINYDPSVLEPCSETSIKWGTEVAALRIPFIITNPRSASEMRADCSTCDIVVFDGGSLTINANRTAHALTIYDGGTLTVNNGCTLTAKSLILSSEMQADNSTQKAPNVSMEGSGTIELANGELYRDMRIDEDRYYFFSLPFDVDNASISYANVDANGKAPVYRTDYWIKYYDGVSRATDANSGVQKKTYWTHVADKGKNFTLKAGVGYEIGIADQKDLTQSDGHKHRKRVIRMTMKPSKAWNTAEKESRKAATVAPSTCINSRDNVHAGWNLIGNPYLYPYTAGSSVDPESGMQNGAWKKEIVNDKWNGHYILDGESSEVPYFTIYNSNDKTYSQVLANSYRALRPFEALFVQINSGDKIYFRSEGVDRESMPPYKRFLGKEKPVRTGITIEGAGQKQQTGIVLSDELTQQYEIGADLLKYTNSGLLNLYTLNADKQQLAFVGLSQQDAIEPIPVGVTFPNAGKYTFAFDAKQYSANALDSLMLIDYVSGETINLLFASYTVNIESAGSIDNRFALIVRLAKTPQVPTDIENKNVDNTKPRKIIRDGHLFILYEEKVYDAKGNRVR